MAAWRAVSYTILCVCTCVCVCICVCVVGQESNITGGDRSWLRADQRAAQDQ